MGRCRIQHDDRRAWPKLVDEAGQNFADQTIRHRENNGIRVAERLALSHTFKTGFVFQSLLALGAHLDMLDVIFGRHKVGRKADPHFAAGSH